MATTIPAAHDRLQPCLLDRLTDDHRRVSPDTPDAWVVNRQRMLELILRDLSWLFNATALTWVYNPHKPDEPMGWGGNTYAEKSVLNYGMPALSGQTASTIDTLELERRVRQVILDFEPRILPDSLEVAAEKSEAQLDQHNQIGFRISGKVWFRSYSLELLLHTDIDVETGRVSVREFDNN